MVFLDVHMPGELDGIAALQEIRVIRPEMGVIMVTGEQDDRTLGRAIELGVAGYVLKPFDFLYLELLLVSKTAGA
jgi:response regulator of citrate/malate metabolism